MLFSSRKHAQCWRVLLSVGSHPVFDTALTLPHKANLQPSVLFDEEYNTIFIIMHVVNWLEIKQTYY